jgi:hypothetical protein
MNSMFDEKLPHILLLFESKAKVIFAKIWKQAEYFFDLLELAVMILCTISMSSTGNWFWAHQGINLGILSKIVICLVLISISSIAKIFTIKDLQ